jgi:hypothetical protein
VNGIWLKPAAATVGVAALADMLEPVPEPAAIEENSTFFWFDACASW